MKRIVPVLLTLLATGLFAQTAAQIEKDIRTLAAPNMEGRGLGTKGVTLAAGYIESRLRARRHVDVSAGLELQVRRLARDVERHSSRDDADDVAVPSGEDVLRRAQVALSE